MIPVSNEFLNAINAPARQIRGRVVVEYTDPFFDPALIISVNETVNPAFTNQVFNGITEPERKWASADGFSFADGSFSPAPSTIGEAEMGIWGMQIAGVEGLFSAPFPTITVEIVPRPVHSLRVAGDNKRGEFPVDFTLSLLGANDVVLLSRNIIGNTLVDWTENIVSVQEVRKIALEVRRWSHSGRTMKIIEIYTAIQETYEGDSIISLNLLEERELSHDSLPIGNISSNEIRIRLNNFDRRFDAGNTQSHLYGLLRQNRRIRAWIGAFWEDRTEIPNPPTFVRNSTAWLPSGQMILANQPRFVSGRFGQAVMVEEGTTNIILPHATVPTLAAGGFSSSAGGTYTIESGWGIIRTNGAIWNLFMSTAVSILPSTAYTFRTQGRNMFAGNVVFEVVFFTDGMGVISSVSRTVLSSDTGGEYSVVIPFTTPATAAFVRFDVRVGSSYSANPAAGGAFSRPQIEQKSFPTTWQTGNTSRLAETLTIPTQNVINPVQGTIEFWWQPINQPASTIVSQATSPPILEVGNYFQNNSFVLWFVNGHLQLLVRGDEAAGWTTEATIISGTAWYTLNKWYHIAIRWQGTSFWVFVDGLRYGPFVSTHALTGVAGNIMSLGGVAIANRTNALYDDLRISNIARSDDEIIAAWTNPQPARIDANTTYLLNIDGNLIEQPRAIQVTARQELVPLGVFWSGEWHAEKGKVYATTSGRDRLEVLSRSTYSTSAVQTNMSLRALATQILVDSGLQASEYWIDPVLDSIVVPFAWFNAQSHRSALRQIAEASLGQVFCDRNGIIRVEGVDFLSPTAPPDITILDTNYFWKDTPIKWGELANRIEVETNPLLPLAVSEEIFRSNEPIPISAGQTLNLTLHYNKTPVINASVGISPPVAGVDILSTIFYAWGVNVRVQSTVNATFILVANGFPLEARNRGRVTLSDTDSIRENGLIRYLFPTNHLVQTNAQAQMIAETLLRIYRHPRRDLEMEWRGNPAVTLGDVVMTPDHGQELRYWAYKQELEFDGGLKAQLEGRLVR